MDIPETLGRYTILKCLAVGGMGEVFLADDPLCARKVAVKRIRPDLVEHGSIRKRFIREAKVASQLTHPSIMPIYAIHQDKENLFYTMPYIEGETLSALIRETRLRESKGEEPHEIGSSTMSLVRIFRSVCQAMAFSHSKGIIHRDLKPENIIVGRFGEVLILDWGIATFVDEKDIEDEEIELPPLPELTKPGKVVGTVSFMAPERAIELKSSPSSDIYSLGVLLYQMLSLRIPFKRPSLKEYRKIAKDEVYTPPQEQAPHRDIPKQLARLCQRCLEFDPKKRFLTVEQIIHALDKYIQGHPEWAVTQTLSPSHQDDWELQENILLTKHLALTRVAEKSAWFMLMISKVNFAGNIRLDARIRFSKDSKGIGFLFSVPERDSLEEGFCLYLDPRGSKLYRDNAEVMDLSEINPGRDQWHHVSIEKLGNALHFYLNGILKMTYVSYVPLEGSHVGLLYRDANFTLENLTVSEAGESAMVNCLTIPDAFLARRQHTEALLEYRKIARSFEGRNEGREALFRIGITLLELDKHEEALEAFEALHETPKAPLEYLGKSLVYRKMGDIEEETKCLELALRKFPKHPLRSTLKEHVLFRLHETSNSDRKGAYHFALIVVLNLSDLLRSAETLSLIKNLIKHWETPYFMTTPDTFESSKSEHTHIATQLAFHLNRPPILYEIYQQETSLNAYLALLFLGCEKEIKESPIPLEVAKKKIQPPPSAREGDESTPYPRTRELLPLFLSGKLPKTWLEYSFDWERLILYQALISHYSREGNESEAALYEKMAEKELSKSADMLSYLA